MDENTRWERVQEQVMNLVTTQRTIQQDLAKMETENVRLAEHVEEVDDHLRGVAGESLDTRVVILERESKAYGNELLAYGGLLRDLNKQLNDLQSDMHSFKIRKDISSEAEASRTERFKEWLKFWGPIVIASLALAPQAGKFVVNFWEKSRAVPPAEYRPDERLRKQIEADKKGARGRAVKRKLAALERATTSYQP